MKAMASEDVLKFANSSIVGRVASMSKVDRAFVERAKGVIGGIAAIANYVCLLECGVFAMVKTGRKNKSS
jgi:hypothetical protein